MEKSGKIFIELLRTTSPGAIQLARLVSLAARVEPELLRAMRLHHLPNVDAGAEADLWFSPLVQASSPLGIVLRPDVLAELRSELAQKENRVLLNEAWETLQLVHESVPDAVRLEERVTYLSLSGASKEAIDESLLPAVAALAKQNNEKVIRWARRVLPRLPENAQKTQAAKILDVKAASKLGKPFLLGNHSPDVIQLVDWLAPGDMEQVPVGVRLLESKRGPRWEFSHPPIENSYTIHAPKTDPIVIEIKRQTRQVDRTETKRVLLPLNDSVTLLHRGPEITIRTGLNKSYVIKLPPAQDQKRDRPAAGKRTGTDFLQESIHYTTAKIVLVGDSGVGKTGLGWRLAHNEFKEHASTHGQQFWTIPQLGLKRADGTECEAVLWDLAGAPVYRQIHSSFLDNVAAAIVVFDPSNRQEPLKGVQFWLERLKGKGQLPPTVLVGARADRGVPVVSQQELEQFCQRYGITGGYISTSSFSGEGLDALLETLKTQIRWDEMTATVTTVTFKRIRDYVLSLRTKLDRRGVLLSPAALREQLQVTDQAWHFTDAEMMTAIGHLETHGYVAVLRSSAGEQHILLTPELLSTLASSIVLLADRHPLELGAVSETDLLRGKFQFDEIAGLSPSETQILLDAAILRFLLHNICFRETLDNESLLIFPGLIKQKRPLQDDLPSTDDVSYVVRGRVENLFASLVVLLGRTPSFTRINQWQNQAQYEWGEGEICGFRLIEDREGEIEVVLYYSDRFPAHKRTNFQELIEQFLYQRDVEVTRFPLIVCVNGHRQNRSMVIERVREGKRFIFCLECGVNIDLPDFDKPGKIGASPWLRREEAMARLRSAYEVELTKVKSYRRDRPAPRCFVSHVAEQSELAKEIIKDLRNAGVYVVEQITHLQPDDFIIVLDTPAYQNAFKTPASALAAEIPLINARFGKRHLIPLPFLGHLGPHEFEDCAAGILSDESHYPVTLFDLVLNLYAIPLTHAGFAPLRRSLHTQWEQTLAPTKADSDASPLKIFISYSHKDEEFKDELVTMLAGLQRQGIVDTWQDRRIEPGDEWNKSIDDAMNECDLILLLISPDYMASRFMQAERYPQFLQSRKEMQRRMIPIIIRPCIWQSEPILRDLQALPENGKAVIKFERESGARDQVWTDIALAIEKRQKLHTKRDKTQSPTKPHSISPLKLFISYSHKDENFKDELVTMLAGLQRRGIVNTWRVRRIERGGDWNDSIENAMNECDLVLLLVSVDYLASRSIQKKQPKPLHVRQEMQLRVIPIIVRPCKWQSEPALKNLQVLPKNGKPIIKFSELSGARDEVWTDIASVIEKFAKSQAMDPPVSS